MPKYRVRSRHAIDLPGGRVAAPHDVVEANAKQVRTLVADGVLVRIPTSKRGSK